MSDAAIAVRSPLFDGEKPIWLVSKADRKEQFACDEDPRNPFHGDLEIIHVTRKSDGTYLYHVSPSRESGQGVTLFAPEHCLTDRDPSGW